MKAEQQGPEESDRSESAIVREIEDPLVRFFEKHWQSALYVLVAFGFLVYLYFGYQRSQEDSRRQAADLYNKVRTSFLELTSVEKKVSDQLEQLEKESAALSASEDATKKSELAEKRAAAEKELKDAHDKLSQRLSALGDVKEPYRSLSKLYAGISALKLGDRAGAKEALGSFGWAKVKDLGSEERFISELAALSLARALLDQPDSFEQGKSVLFELSNAAEFVKPSAALAYARSATSAEERAAAISLLKKVQNLNPEYAELLKQQIERM